MKKVYGSLPLPKPSPLALEISLLYNRGKI